MEYGEGGYRMRPARNASRNHGKNSITRSRGRGWSLEGGDLLVREKG